MRELKECRVLVTPTSFGVSNPELRRELEAALGEVIYNDRGRPLLSEELRELLPECDGYIAGLDQIDSDALEVANRLRVIARYGVGVDRVDLRAAAAHGIVVTNTPHANAASVAELTVALLLALARSIPAAYAGIQRGQWPRLQGQSLQGKIFGLVGFGAVGREVTRWMKGSEMKILAFDPYVTAETVAACGAQLVSLEELRQSADFLSLHLPATAATRGMIDAAFLSGMKRGAYLINTARGELVREDALLAALDTGHLAGAALDVYAVEPPPADSRLRNHPRLLATPHCGAHTDGAAECMGRESVHDCLAVLRGQMPLHPIA